MEGLASALNKGHIRANLGFETGLDYGINLSYANRNINGNPENKPRAINIAFFEKYFE